MNYCDICGREVQTKIVTKKENYIVRGENISVDTQVLICTECGEEIFCEELDAKTLAGVHNEYRQRHLS